MLMTEMTKLCSSFLGSCKKIPFLSESPSLYDPPRLKREVVVKGRWLSSLVAGLCYSLNAISVPVNETIYDDGERMATLSVITLRINDGAKPEWIQSQASENKELATQGLWDLSWFANDEDKGVSACTFTHKEQKNTHAIAIKGQNQKNIEDLFHGLGVLWEDKWHYPDESGNKGNQTEIPYKPKPASMKGVGLTSSLPWQHPASSKSELKISVGAKDYIEDLLSLVGSYGKWQGLKITDIIDQLLKDVNPTPDNPLTLYVTGDSLGGSGAVLMSTYIYEVLKQRSLGAGSVYLNVSISNAPALYNGAFADYYNNLILDKDIKVTQRFYSIEHDIVSNYFAHNIKGLAPGILNVAAPLKDSLIVAFDPIAEYLELTDAGYTQVGSVENKTRTMLKNRATNNLPGKIKSPVDLVKYYEYYHFSGSLFDSMGEKGIPHVPCPPGGCIGEQ